MNNRGQAMIESLLLGCVVIISLFFFLHLALRMQKNILLDELIEQTLICMAQKNPLCLESFRQQLITQKYQKISAAYNQFGNKWSLQLKAETAFNEIIEKESELEYDLAFFP